MLKTINGVLSERLQAAGTKVTAMSGGLITMPLAYYFDTTIAKAGALVNKKTGEKVFNADELAEFETVKAPEKTPDPSKTNIKELVTKGKKDNENVLAEPSE